MSDEIAKKIEDEAIFMTEQCYSIVEQFRRKNTAYGDSFGKQFAKYGPISVLIRLGDKFSRTEALILGAENKVDDERLEDTISDLACYCLMTLFEMNQAKAKKEEDMIYVNPCLTCGAKGQIMKDNMWFTCKRCNGTGEIRRKGGVNIEDDSITYNRIHRGKSPTKEDITATDKE